MKSFRTGFALVVALVLAATSSAHAGMINLNYSGSNEDTPYINAIGFGQFTYVGSGPKTLTLSSLTAFAFQQTTTLSDPGLSGSGTYTYGLQDLVSFSATIAASGAVTSLSLETGYVDPSNDLLNPQYLMVFSLDEDGTTSFQEGRDGDVTTGTTVATIAPSAVPEPSSLLLCGLAGTLSLGYRQVRRRCSSARSAGD